MKKIDFLIIYLRLISLNLAGGLEGFNPLYPDITYKLYNFYQTRIYS